MKEWVQNVGTDPLWHAALVQLQEANGVNMGHRFVGRYGASAMVEFISKTMKNDFILSVTQSNSPLAIIVDGSSDLVKQHYLVVLLQTVLDGQPTVVFYGLIPIGVDESAKGLYNAIMSVWEEEPHDFLS